MPTNTRYFVKYDIYTIVRGLVQRKENHTKATTTTLLSIFVHPNHSSGLDPFMKLTIYREKKKNIGTSVKIMALRPATVTDVFEIISFHSKRVCIILYIFNSSVFTPTRRPATTEQNNLHKSVVGSNLNSFAYT